MFDGSKFSLAFSRALGKVVVYVHGSLGAGSAPTLKERLVDIIDGQGERQVVLDLRGVTGVDFAGMLVLADALLRMEEHGGELVLSGPTSRVAEQLRAGGLDELVLITPEWRHPARGGVDAKRGRERDRSR